MFKFKNLPLTISTIVLISLIVGWGISMVLAWVDPTANPPLDNVSAPINVSLTAQTKTGDLNIGSTIQLEAVAGDVTANTFLGKISAGNVTAGEFGSLQGGGNYSFPANVTATGTICDVNGCIGAGGGVDGCTDCLNATEIEDIYVFNTSDTMSGTLRIGGGSIEIVKSGTNSDIFFPAQTNDPGYIRHYESSNTGIMYFSASDDKTTGDYFSFGSDPGGVYNEGARLTTSGNLQLDGSLTVDRIFSQVNAVLPRIVLDSSSSGDNWTSQGAYISLGESGNLGSAALHLTYRGDGYGWIGSGAVTNAIPAYAYLRFDYNSKNIYTDSILRADGGFQVDGLWAINSANTQHRVTSGNSYSKYCLWNGSTYCIGMYSAQTYGGLNDYAMTFTMNADADRGWLWRDSSDAASDGAMSLTTTGVLTVKTSLTVDKIYVGTIDPIYEIDGKKYATYVSDFAGGVRTETSGVIQLNSEAKYVIDFDNLEKETDIWLFWETSNKEMDDLVVILGPGFEGKAWYEKDGHKLTIYGDEPGEVSYRLTLPRLDDEEWGNILEDHENKEN